MNELVVPAISFSDMERLAVSVARSGLFGVKNPDQALALMAISQAEGRHPALIIRDYDIIQNRPAKKAEAMQRDFQAAGGRIEWHELTDTKAAATFSHPQGGSVKIDWDLARAQKAGFASKDNWKKFPRAMLRARVVSEGVRTVYPAATSGMYVPEEVRDFAPIDVTPQRQTIDYDRETGEVHEGVPSDLEHQGDAQATQGTETLRQWWMALSSQQRGELGARGRSSGPHMEKWKAIAEQVDQQQVPAEEPQEPLAEGSRPDIIVPQADPFDLVSTDDEARENIVKQAMVCTTLDEIAQLKDNWEPRLKRMSEQAWNATMAGIGARETELWRASRTTIVRTTIV